MLLLLIFGIRALRAYRLASRRRAELSAYALAQAEEIDRLAASLNEHGFQLEHTMTELGPKLELMSAFLSRPLVAASVPWLLRRVMMRPYRRR